MVRVNRKLIPYLRNVSRWLWLLIFGGLLLFIVIALTVAAQHPDTPANQLFDWQNGWLFAFPAAMVILGLRYSFKYWRCPGCGWPPPTKHAVPERCPRCGAQLSYDPRAGRAA
jgi:hypothetical protein